MPARICKLISAFAEGEWLHRRMAIRCAAALLVFELAFFLFAVAGTHGWIVRLEHPVSTDFVSFYAAGELAGSGVPERAYDQAAHYDAEQRATEPGIPYEYFFYPPVFLLLCRLLAVLPYFAAFVVFQAATLAMFLLSVRAVLGERGSAWAIPVLAAPAVFWTLGLGQNAFLTAALFAGATVLLERRPLLAGVLFGALCYKPHFGLLVPLALAAGGHWRTFAAAAACVAVLSLGSLLAFGWAVWGAYLHVFFASPELFAAGRAAKLAGLVTPFGALRLLGVGDHAARSVQACIVLLAAALVTWIWSGQTSLPVRAASLVTATLAAVPVALLYDLTLALVAVAWLIRAGRAGRFARWEKPAFVAVALVPLYQIQAGELTHISPAPFVVGASLALCVARARREARLALAVQPRRPGSPPNRLGGVAPSPHGAGSPLTH